jgi:hypothetical protein
MNFPVFKAAGKLPFGRLSIIFLLLKLENIWQMRLKMTQV